MSLLKCLCRRSPALDLDWSLRRLAFVAMSVAALLSSGCGRAKPRRGAEGSAVLSMAEVRAGLADDTIRLVQVAAFTGPQAGLGTEVYLGARAYFLDVNQKGGIFGRTVKIVPLDDHYSTEGAVEAATRALSDEDPFIFFNGAGTEPTAAVLRVLSRPESGGAFLWGTTSGAEVSREGALGNFAFNVRGSLKASAHDIVSAYASAGFKRIGIVVQDDGFGESAAAAVRSAATKRGLEVVLEEPIAKGTKLGDGTSPPIVAKLRSANADAIAIAATYNPSAAFIRDARTQGWNVPVATLGSPDTMLRLLVAEERKTGNRMTLAVLACLDTPPLTATELPAVRDYLEAAARGIPPVPTEIADPNYRPLPVSAGGLEGYITARVLAEALQRAGRDLTRDSLRKAIETIRHWDPGVDQQINFGPGDNQGFDRTWLVGVQDDRFVMVTDPKGYLADKSAPKSRSKKELTAK